MKSRIEKILSWSPLITIILLALVAWQFLYYNGKSGGENLLSAACSGEQKEKVEQSPFLIIYRKKGCSDVSPLVRDELLNDIRWWKEISKPLSLPPLRDKTAVDLRPGKFSAYFLFGQPGAIALPVTYPEQQRYYLAKGIIFLTIKESYPQMRNDTAKLVAGALTLHLLERDSFRVIAPEKERILSERILPLWPDIIRSCKKCSAKDILQKINQSDTRS